MKKILCILMLFVVVVSSLPIQCFAAEILPVSVEITKLPDRPFVFGHDSRYSTDENGYFFNDGAYYRLDYDICDGAIALITFSDGSTQEIAFSNGLDIYKVSSFKMYLSVIAEKTSYQNDTIELTFLFDFTIDYDNVATCSAKCRVQVLSDYVTSLELISMPTVKMYRGYYLDNFVGLSFKATFFDGSVKTYCYGETDFDNAFRYYYIGDTLGEFTTLAFYCYNYRFDLKLALHEMPYSSIKIDKIDFMQNERYINSITFTLQKTDGGEEQFTINDIGNFGTYTVNDYEFFVYTNSSGIYDSTVTVEYLGLSDEITVDSRTEIVKIFEKIVFFFYDCIFFILSRLF